MMIEQHHSVDAAVRAANVIELIKDQCAPYLHADDLLSHLFDCYWERAQTTDPNDRAVVFDIVSQILYEAPVEAWGWTELLFAYDPAESLRQLLEPLIDAHRLDGVLARYQARV